VGFVAMGVGAIAFGIWTAQAGKGLEQAGKDFKKQMEQAAKEQEAIMKKQREGQEQGRRRELEDKMQRVAKALVDYRDANGRCRPQATPIKGGQGLSWRVALLKYMGPQEQALYNRFRHDESWNSPNNFPLLNDMPDVYRKPSDFGRIPFTHFQ